MNIRTIQWVGFGVVVIVLGGLFAWYIFISEHQKAAGELGEGRGFTSGVPTFVGGGGSTRKNMVSFFGESSVKIATTSNKKVPPRLWGVSAVPSVGLASFETPAGTFLRFVERPTGNVFEVPLSGGELRRITNTLIPRVYGALWVNDDSLVIRHSDESGLDLLTFLAQLKYATSTGGMGSLSGAYLDTEVSDVAVSPNRKSPALFYLTTNDQGTFGIVTDGDAKNPKRLFTSALSGWRASWVAENSIVLSQKAADGLVGSAYVLSPKVGSMHLIKGNVEGLIVAAHSKEDAVIYSISKKGVVETYARVSGVERKLPITTLAEKCVWEHVALRAYCAVPEMIVGAALPDVWYRGEVSFNDRWFVIDPISGNAELFLDPTDEFGVSVDVVDPVIDADGAHIFFTDAKNGTVWVLTL